MAKIDLSKSLTPKAILNLLVILGFLIFVLWILLFLGGEIKQGALDVGQKRAQIDSRIAAISRLTELRQEAEEASSALKSLQNIVPIRDDLLSVPRYVERLASGSNVTASFDFTGAEQAPEGDRAGSSSFKIIAKGPYPDLLSFIGGLERGDFFITINSIEITIQGDGTFGANIDGLVYFRG